MKLPSNIVYEKIKLEQHDGVYYKRDDLFAPFDTPYVNGGKVRQGLSLILNNLDYIKNQCDNTIITPVSVHSYQAVVISKICSLYNIKCIIALGATTKEKAIKHKTMYLCKLLGSELKVFSKLGFLSVLLSKINEYTKNHPAFLVDYGMNLTHYTESILGVNAHQTQYLPNNIDNIIIPSGSGVSGTGILWGLAKYHKKVKRVICVHVGPDRKKIMVQNLTPFKLNNYTLKFPRFEMVKSNLQPYGKEIEEYFGNNIRLDPTYEAKAHRWMKDNINTKKEKTIFWIVGCKPTWDNIKEIENANV